ncbi:MAG: hypothetical protein Q4B69_02655 [Slackia sp.]|nr:hypothetical protein [Slackia sp.]
MKARALITTIAAVALGASLVGCSSGTIKAEDDDSYSSSSYSSTESSTSSSSDSDKSSTSSSKSNSDDDDYETYSYSSGGKSYETTKSDDGSSLTRGSDGYTQYKHKDGTSMATDGKGNFISDTDGNGSPDSYSTDGGSTWDEL